MKRGKTGARVLPPWMLEMQVPSLVNTFASTSRDDAVVNVVTATCHVAAMGRPGRGTRPERHVIYSRDVIGHCTDSANTIRREQLLPDESIRQSSRHHTHKPQTRRRRRGWWCIMDLWCRPSIPRRIQRQNARKRAMRPNPSRRLLLPCGASIRTGR